MNRNILPQVTVADSPSSRQGALGHIRFLPAVAGGWLIRLKQQLALVAAMTGRPEIQVRSHALQWQQGWPWSAAILVLLLLAAAGLLLPLLAVWKQHGPFLQPSLDGTGTAWLALLLLFSAYVIHQQTLIQRFRNKAAQQTGSAFQFQFQVEESYPAAMLDPLTGLYKRSFLEQHLTTEVARSQRNNLALTVLALDLKDFKQINDSYGSAAGDLVLKQFGVQLKKAIRSSDVAARSARDEFLVLFPECRPEQVPLTLLRLLDLDVDFHGQKIPVGFAAGWTAYQPGDSPGQLLDRAAEAILVDKESGSSQQEIREAQAQVRQLQKMEALGRLAGGVAHDLNNLLTLVKGYSELALDRLGRVDPLRTYIEQILRAVERMNSLIWQLLAFSRRQALNLEVLDLNELLAEMEPRLARVVGEQTEVELVPGVPLGPVLADRRQLQQVILNLALNARDAMPHGGKLALETANVELNQEFVRRHRGAQPGRSVLLEVSDTGIGMDAETLTHIFEPFFTTKEKGNGTGLGLSTAYGIIKQIAGYIWVNSQPGQGTTFRIYLPRIEEAAEATWQNAEKSTLRTAC